MSSIVPSAVPAPMGHRVALCTWARLHRGHDQAHASAMGRLSASLLSLQPDREGIEELDLTSSIAGAWVWAHRLHCARPACTHVCRQLADASHTTSAPHGLVSASPAVPCPAELEAGRTSALRPSCLPAYACQSFLVHGSLQQARPASGLARPCAAAEGNHCAVTPSGLPGPAESLLMLTMCAPAHALLCAGPTSQPAASTSCSWGGGSQEVHITCLFQPAQAWLEEAGDMEPLGFRAAAA